MSYEERDRGRLFARITTGEMYHNSNGHPSGVAVFTTGYANIGNPWVRLHRLALFIRNCGSSQRHGLHRRRSVGEDISDAS